MFLSCFVGLTTAWAQTSDPVVMTIAGKQIVRSEFEYAFNKNVEKGKEAKDFESIKEYAEMFINYKLKVKAAEDAKLDTLGGLLKEYRLYRDTQLRPFVRDSFYVDSIMHIVYDMLKEQVGDSDMIQVAHIYLPVPQRNGEQIRAAQKKRIDSLYVAIKGGSDFMELARKYSEDPNVHKGDGLSPWIVPQQMLPEFESRIYPLQIGEVSDPFESPAGYHILMMKGRKKLEPYEEKKPEIKEMLEERGIDDMSAEYRIEKMMSNENKTREEVVLEIQNKAIKDNPQLNYLINEYHDGLLMYEASRIFVWDKAAEDVKGLENYFKKNKKKFKWDASHFKGYVIFAKNESLANDAEKFFQKYKGENGVGDFNKLFNKDSLNSVRVRSGVFAVGNDPYVDAEIFGKEKPQQAPQFPVYRVVGKLMKQPKSYTDVESQIVSDYQDTKEKEWVEELRKKYTFSIDEKVLKTVNNH